MNFEIDESQVVKLNAWKEAIKIVYGKYGEYVFTFSDSGIGQTVKVYSELAKTTLDLTEYEKW